MQWNEVLGIQSSGLRDLLTSSFSLGAQPPRKEDQSSFWREWPCEWGHLEENRQQQVLKDVGGAILEPPVLDEPRWAHMSQSCRDGSLYVSTWLGYRMPRSLVKHYSGCIQEGFWMSLTSKLVDWVKQTAHPLWSGLIQSLEGLNRTKILPLPVLELGYSSWDILLPQGLKSGLEFIPLALLLLRLSSSDWSNAISSPSSLQLAQCRS